MDECKPLPLGTAAAAATGSTSPRDVAARATPLFRGVFRGCSGGAQGVCTVCLGGVYGLFRGCLGGAQRVLRVCVGGL